jgi:hypothetical protein
MAINKLLARSNFLIVAREWAEFDLRINTASKQANARIEN